MHFSSFLHNWYDQHISDESGDEKRNARVIESIFQVIGIIHYNVPRNALTFSLYILCDGRVVQL